MTDFLDAIHWNPDGLVPVVTQDAHSGRVLMLAWANREALTATVTEGQAVYWSRSRQALWRKGETSGHRQRMIDIRLDCDGDTLCYVVEQAGGIACHTGRESCFFRRLQSGQWTSVDPVLVDPATLYPAPHSA